MVMQTTVRDEHGSVMAVVTATLLTLDRPSPPGSGS
jgi:hypothetical protein